MFDVINAQGGSISTSSAPFSSQSTPIGSGDTFSSMASQGAGNNSLSDSFSSEQGGNDPMLKMMGRLVEMISALLENEGVIDTEDSTEDDTCCEGSGTTDSSGTDGTEASSPSEAGAHSGPPGGGEGQGMTDIFAQLLELLTAILEQQGVIDSESTNSDDTNTSDTSTGTSPFDTYA